MATSSTPHEDERHRPEVAPADAGPDRPTQRRPRAEREMCDCLHEADPDEGQHRHAEHVRRILTAPSRRSAAESAAGERAA